MKQPQILIDAQDNWPEDEASLLADTVAGRKENGWTDEELHRATHRDIAHMHKVFSMEDDANELVTRFNGELLKRGIDVKALLF